ncbi:hypothetical protein MtrunA17_Chr6g0471651 [Medicago truncatula]|uniref:Transmembrane protein, putative n=1 Tax=Medicago truncatula TaxID=3880 RepID=A0A072TDS1_MEDTR|nr:transmembrane protein, putative [Medicago truncatula]RHN51693.1 hypothetical protein MtrunA17_Chr6g0471651 [Medicago truncatula]
MREVTVNQVIANISTTNAILQIVFILILFGQVTCAWSWWTCLGANLYTITIEFFFPERIQIDCYSTGFPHPSTYARNNTFLDIKFCGSFDWFGKTAPWYCKVITKYPACEAGFVQKYFEVFNEDFDCAKDKEEHCRWQIHKEEYLTLYNPKKNISEKRYYYDTSCISHYDLLYLTP